MVSSVSGSSSAYAAKARSGISGLASGMDTDAIVKDMTLGTRNKITKIKQQQQLLAWQSEAFRSITSDLQNFKKKYLDSTSSTNLLSAAFYQNAMGVGQGANSSSVSVTGSSNGLKNFVIGSVDKLATTANYVSGSISNSMDTGTIDLNGTTPFNNLKGESLSLTYNGAAILIDLGGVDPKAADPAAELIKNINKQLEDKGYKDKIEVALDGSSIKINNIGGSELKIANVTDKAKDILGVATDQTVAAGGSLVGTGTLNSSTLVSEKTFAEVARMGGKFNLNFDGQNVTVDLNSDAIKRAIDAGDMNEFAKAIQDSVNKALGGNKVAVSAKNVVGGSGELSFTTTREFQNSILSVAGGDGNVLGEDGIMKLNPGSANRLLMNETLTSANYNGPDLIGKTVTINDITFTIGEKSIELSNGETKDFENGVRMHDIINTINGSSAGVTMSYMSTTGTFNIAAKNSGAAGRVELSGNGAEALFGLTAGETVSIRGEDSKATVSFDGGKNFVEIVRGSNAYSMDGININLNSTFDGTLKGADGNPILDAAGNVQYDATKTVKFSAEANTDDIVKAVKGMVEDYNAMIAKINGEVSTKKDRSYEPLTEDQRKAMSEDEIKTWEKKAKKGILFGDTTLSGLSNDLRFSFSMPIDGMMLKDLGITTGSSWTENGKLGLDEAKFRAALDSRPEDIVKMLTGQGAADPSQGALAKINGVVDKYTKTFGGKGLLIQKAGHESSPLSELDNDIYNRNKSYIADIKRWETKLKTEEDRYYKQFASMETYLNQMNSQSSWLQQQFQ